MNVLLQIRLWRYNDICKKLPCPYFVMNFSSFIFLVHDIFSQLYSTSINMKNNKVQVNCYASMCFERPGCGEYM